MKVKGLLLLRDLFLTALAVALLWPLYVLPWRAAARLGHALGTLVSVRDRTTDAYIRYNVNAALRTLK